MRYISFQKTIWSRYEDTCVCLVEWTLEYYECRRTKGSGVCERSLGRLGSVDFGLVIYDKPP